MLSTDKLDDDVCMDNDKVLVTLATEPAECDESDINERNSINVQIKPSD